MLGEVSGNLLEFPSRISPFRFTPAMPARLAALFMIVSMMLAPAVHASGKKESKISIMFHMETEGSDNPKMIFPQLANGQQRFFRRMPEFSTKDILSFSPFASQFDGDYGIIFKLKGSAANRLVAISNMNQGRWMVAQISGRVLDGVMIDKQIDDGVLVIWKGVTLEDIRLLDETFPRIGEEGKKKKKK
jgi:hypothetical protein